MNVLGVAILVLFILGGATAFAFVRGIRGITVIVALGWLIVSPRAFIPLSGLPELTKDVGVSYAILIGLVVVRSDLLRNFRFQSLDLFVLGWIGAPFISSIANGLGLWDACSELYERFFIWGVPYLAGRIGVRSLRDVRECAIGVIIAGLIAAPLCLIEIRLSPQIHRWIYGVHPAPFHMSMRLGGYRPMLSFRHGIEVGTWMACASIVAAWFGLIAGRDRLFSVPMRAHGVILFVVTVMCRSLGTLALLFGSIAVLLFTRASRMKIAILLLVLATPTYIGLRTTGIWSPDMIADVVETFIDGDRADSMRARTFQEDEMGAKASQRRFFGWGGHNRFRVFDDYGEATTPIDALWLIAYGKNGLLGLIGLYGMLCAPAFLIVRRTPANLLLHPNMAGVVGLILALMIATGDSLQNAFFSPLMMMSAGVLVTTATSLRSWLPSPNRVSQSPATAPPNQANTSVLMPRTTP